MLLGFPRKTYNLQKETKIVNVEYESIEKLIKQGYSLLSAEPEMTYALPDWVQKILKSKKSILHIDEYNRAFPHIKQAVMELINAGEYGSFTLPTSCQIVLTSNPNTGDYNIVSDDDEAHKDRYFHLPIRFDIMSWGKWAINNNINSKYVEYLIKNPEVISSLSKTEAKLPSVRMWTRFFKSIKKYNNFDDVSNRNMINNLGNISVGATNVLHFINYISSNTSPIPSMQEVFDVKIKDDVILEKLEKSFTDEETNVTRDDIKAIIGFKINNYLLNYTDIVSTAFVERIKLLFLSHVINPDSVLQIIYNIIDTNKKNPNNRTIKKIKELLTSDSEIQELLIN